MHTCHRYQIFEFTVKYSAGYDITKLFTNPFSTILADLSLSKVNDLVHDGVHREIDSRLGSIVFFFNLRKLLEDLSILLLTK